MYFVITATANQATTDITSYNWAPGFNEQRKRDTFIAFLLLLSRSL